MESAYAIAFMIIAYLVGAIPTGLFVSRAFGGVDPRSSGSGNIGATNVGRTSGKAAGILTLIGDMLKGALPVFVAIKWGGSPLMVSAVGLAAFIGHLFPAYLGFKGGKGVATAIGIILIISPPAAGLCAIVWVSLVAVKKYVSLGSIVSAALLPVFLSFMPAYKAYVPLGVAFAVLVIIKHKDNIKRLASGTENKVGGKKG